jgi:hypothetical protein
MNRVRVKISVTPKITCDNLYIVGSTHNLGEWDPSRATQLKYNEETSKIPGLLSEPVEENTYTKKRKK